MTRESTTPGPAPEHVFGDDRPFAQCHAATLVATPGGGFLAAWFGGTREGESDVAIWGANRRPGTPSRAGVPGAGWSPPRVLAKVDARPHWNPVLYALDGDGTDLVLQFKVGERIRHWQTFCQRSRDAGSTWSAARPLVPGDVGGRGAVRTKPIRLASGDWLAGASRERWRRWDAFFDRSANGLDDWQATEDVSIDHLRFKGKGLIQPSLWESAPGQIHALFRSTDGRLHRSDSQDDGRAWSPPTPTSLSNNNSGIDVVRAEDGRLVLACNPVAGNWAARTPLSLLVSEDEGVSWPVRLDVETAAGEYSYPALIATAEGVALAYTWNRRRIAFLELRLPVGTSTAP